MQKAFFDNETANSIADPETYNRSDNRKVDIHVDHTSPTEEPTSGFGEMCPIFMMKHMKRAHEHTYRSQRPVGGSAGWGSSRAIDSRIERGVGISTSEVSTHIRHVQSQLRTARCVRVGAALY